MALDLTPSRLRLLFLLPFPPRLQGHHGGATVVGQLLAGLARRHDVAALYLTQRGEPALEEELDARCELLEAVERTDAGGLRSRVAFKLALLRGIPTWASELADSRFAARAAELAAQWKPDVVQLEYPVMGQYLPALDRCPAPRVLGEHDAVVRDLRTWRGPLGRMTRALDDRAWRSFEPRVMGGVQATVVFTDRDRRALEQLGSRTPIVEIPFGTLIPDSALDPVGGSPPAVLFVGNFRHPPNADAAHWLASDIFPPLRAEHPDARLIIVGPSPSAEIAALADEAVAITGEVPEVTPYLRQAAVVAAPLRLGGGMRVKVLEALASGKAVVATPLAVEGLDVTAGDQLEIAASEGDFRRALSRLLGDESARRALGGRAREWATEYLGWGSPIARYEELYASLLGRGDD